MGETITSALGPMTTPTDEHREAGEHALCSITRLDAVQVDGGRLK